MNEIKLEGTEELLANLKKINGDIRTDVALKAVNDGALQIENQARINAPVLTSALRNSAKTICKNTPNGAEAEIGFRGLAYAKIQEYGGTITARNHKYLTFKTKAGWRRKKSVKIVGKHYFEKAINSEKGHAVEAMGNVIKSYLEK